MKRFFLLLSILYFCLCLVGSSVASNWVANLIKNHGWASFNAWLYPVLFFALGVICGLCIQRLRIQKPSSIEIIIALIGLALSIGVLSRAVLLSTELIHIPQFAILTILLCIAFHHEPYLAFGWSGLACVADEWAQSFIPGRVLDLNDIGLNWVGLFAGGLICWAWGVRYYPAKKDQD